jgi:DNA-directed RNA polymerase specialized sigma24 family protein
MEPRAESPSEILPFSLPSLPDAGEESWEIVVRRYEGALRSRIWRQLERLEHPPSRELVQEILQEVYCRLVQQALRRLRGRSVGELLAYVGTIAEHAVFDHLRLTRAGKRQVREVRLGRRLEQIADPRQNPERDLLLAESRRLVLRSCRDTSRHGVRRRNVWVARLALLEEWTSQEVAVAAGGRLSPGHVACLVHRLRRRLLREGFAPLRRKRRRGV